MAERIRDAIKTRSKQGEVHCTTGPIEFWGAGTMRTFRPLWIAEELGLEYTLHVIGPRTGETQTPITLA